MDNKVTFSEEDDCYIARAGDVEGRGDTHKEAMEDLVDESGITEDPWDIDWEFVEDPPDQSSSDDDWYALHEGGYLKPEAILDDPEQVLKVREAEAILASFFEAVREADIRGEM